MKVLKNYQNEVCLRAFNTLLKDGNQKTVWTLVLNKGTFYRFRLFEQEGEGEEGTKKIPEKNVNLQLYDAFNPENEKPYGIADYQSQYTFDFNCEETAMYFVSINYSDSVIENTNVVGILYFLGKTK